jgi:hypothetical protein
MPRTQIEDGSWKAMEFGSGNAECGMRKGGRKCEQGEKAWMLCGWEAGSWEA